MNTIKHFLRFLGGMILVINFLIPVHGLCYTMGRALMLIDTSMQEKVSLPIWIDSLRWHSSIGQNALYFIGIPWLGAVVWFLIILLLCLIWKLIRIVWTATK